MEFGTWSLDFNFTSRLIICSPGGSLSLGGWRRLLTIIAGAVPEVEPEAFEAAGVDDGVVGVRDEGAGAEGDDGPGVETGRGLTGEVVEGGQGVGEHSWLQASVTPDPIYFLYSLWLCALFHGGLDAVNR